MPSIIPGFEYDIFISYRHNDNLDGWVTDFVQNLEKELKGTLKDSVSIYFDKNPHDGLPIAIGSKPTTWAHFNGDSTGSIATRMTPCFPTCANE